MCGYRKRAKLTNKEYDLYRQGGYILNGHLYNELIYMTPENWSDELSEL